MNTTESIKLFIKKIEHWTNEYSDNEEKLNKMDDILAEAFDKILKLNRP